MTDLAKYGFSARPVAPQGTGSIGVMIVGEAPGEQEDKAGIPFCPWAPAGAVLERAIRRLGLNREQFAITNVVAYRPPNNFLENAPWEAEAIAACQPMLAEAIAAYQPRCIMTLGNVATRSLSGLAGRKMGVTHLTGFVLPSPNYLGTCVVPCFHPSYLRRGKMSHLGVLMGAIRLAIQVAREGRQPCQPPVDNPPPGYVLHPTEDDARHYLNKISDDEVMAYDIETPYSTEEDEAEEAEGEQLIKSIQFSRSYGEGIFIPWRGDFIGIAKHALGSRCSKLGFNIWRFDDPVLQSAGVTINGERLDLMWAWHHAQPDLPRNLQFAAAQLGWPWPWKHLDASDPTFYGVVDVDVLQWMWQL